MKLSGPIVAGLGLAGLLVAAPHARAVVASPLLAAAILAPILQEGRGRTRSPPPDPARAQQEATDAYNYIAGLFDQGFHDRVAAEAKKFLERWPDHGKAPLVRYRLGQALFDQGKFADARAALLTLETPPDGFEFGREVAFRLAQCALELGDAKEAARRFDAVVDDSAGHYLLPAAAFHAGEAHFRAGSFAAAAKSYGRAVETDDAEYARGALHGLGWALYKAGEFGTAASAFDLFARKHANDPAAAEAWFLLGECRIKLGKPADALSAWQKVPQGEWYDDALSAAGFACAAQNDDARAAQMFLRLEQAAPDSALLPEARLHAGIHLQKLGRDPEAAAVLDRLLASDTTTPTGQAAEAAWWRGVVARKVGGPADALPFFERGLAAKPPRELAERLALARADALFDAGRFDEAKDAYAKAGGSSEDAAYSSAVAALNGNDAEGATQRARDFLQRYPQGRHAAAAALVLGEALFAREKWADALDAFTRAANADERSAEGRATLRPRALSRAGWCLFKVGRTQEAAGRFTNLVEEFPKDERAAEASFMAGRALLRAGETATAEPALERHLQRFPQTAFTDDARYDLAQCKRALGKTEEAERLLGKLAQSGGATDAGLRQRALLEQAELHAAADRHEQALAALEPLLHDAGNPAIQRPALYAQAWSCFALDRQEDAGAALERLLADPKLPAEVAAPALELLVSVARGRKDGRAASAAFEHLARIAPEGERTPEAAFVAALALDESGDPRAGAALLEKASQRWPAFSGRDRLAFQRALLLAKAGDADRSKEAFARLATEFAASPLRMEAAFHLGEACYAAGDFPGALAQYAKAAVEGSRVADAAIYKSGWCHFQEERFAPAADCFGQVAARFGESPLVGESRYLAGEARYRAGQFEQALVPLAAFLEQHPRHEHRPKALFRVGLCHGELGRLDDCFDALAKLEREVPEFALRPEADLWIGRAFLARKRSNDALARFDAVIRADRGVLAARAHLGRGDALKAQGRLDDALGEYLKVSLLFSTEAEVARALWLAGQCLEELGDAEKAKARYRELAEKHAAAPEAKSAKARLAELGTTRGL